jgi:hypothetical protein
MRPIPIGSQAQQGQVDREADGEGGEDDLRST